MLRRRTDGLYEFRWVESAIIASAPDRLSVERRHALRHRVMSQLGEQEAAPMRGFAGLIPGSARERWILVPAGVGVAAAIAAAVYASGSLTEKGDGRLAASVSGDVLVDGTSQSSVGPGEKVFARSNAWLTFAGGARFGLVEGTLLRYSEGTGGRISVELSSGDVTFLSAAQPIDVSRAALLLTMLPGSVARVTLSADGTLVGVTEGQVLANDGGTSSVLSANDVRYFALARAAVPAIEHGGPVVAPTTTTGGVAVPSAIPASVAPAGEPQDVAPGGSAEGPAHGDTGQPGTTESGSPAKPGGAVPPENSNAGGNGSLPSSDNQRGHSDPPVNSNAGGNANPPASGGADGSVVPPANSNEGGNGNSPANSNAGGNGNSPANSNAGGDANPSTDSNAGGNGTPHTNSNAGGDGNAPKTSNAGGNQSPPPSNAGAAGAPAAAASNGNDGAAPGQVKKAADVALLAQAPAEAPPLSASAPQGSNASMKGNAGDNAPASSNAGGNAASADAPGHNT